MLGESDDVWVLDEDSKAFKGLCGKGPCGGAGMQ